VHTPFYKCSQPLGTFVEWGMHRKYNTADEAAAAAEKYAAENGPIEFDGDSECVDCAGWDGVSRRCDCGNRRVSWDIESNPDGTFYVVARAY